MSTSTRRRRISPAAVRSYRPTPIRCERSTGCSGAAVCATANSVIRPALSSTKSGRSVFTPAVSSHSLDQPASSRPEVSSSAASRSASVALPHACWPKYRRTPATNCSRPTYATSCLSTDAPLAYVIPSKLTSTAAMSGMSAAIGCVDGSWSCW